ncbi:MULTISPECIES: hypothetical protein [unclassified Marinobacterium]|uniref:hypothetical protein n=1 Tax=unclassified Marinobacterium TaxID=2644139 RepID=UPI0015697BD8|nr:MULTISPECIES: hypothetical protein [unclassified Marinobacterium]NRP53831.1 hypothetical protein [Marinobacterium sp. xm-v-242]NRP58422.1 hypothetical protein [Marinobacterium sp. xm-d-510]NRP60641.1 hypothetical protein [Marinobacterium sp. xm-d-564]
MNDRYRITIQNPMYSLEVFVWDREKKEVLFSTRYREFTIEEQRAAKQRCADFLDNHLSQLTLDFGE